MGGIPRLFMAVAQAFGSDMGIVMELESIVMLQIPSVKRKRVTQTRDAIIYVTSVTGLRPMKGPFSRGRHL